MILRHFSCSFPYNSLSSPLLPRLSASCWVPLEFLICGEPSREQQRLQSIQANNAWSGWSLLPIAGRLFSPLWLLLWRELACSHIYNTANSCDAPEMAWYMYISATLSSSPVFYQTEQLVSGRDGFEYLLSCSLPLSAYFILSA